MQKTKIILLAAALSFLTVLPIAAHGGDEEIGAGIVTASSNLSLLGISSVLSFGLLAIAYLINTKIGSLKHIGIIVLTGLSAFIHLGLGIRGDFLLLLNGLGYLGLIAGLILPIAIIIAQRGLVYWLLLAFTAVTFVGFFALHPLGIYSRMGLLTKAIEFGLIILTGLQIWESKAKSSKKAVIAS